MLLPTSKLDLPTTRPSSTGSKLSRKPLARFKTRFFKIAILLLLLSAVVSLGFRLQTKLKGGFRPSDLPENLEKTVLGEIDQPTIVGGELLLPKVNKNNLEEDKLSPLPQETRQTSKIRVVSANLVGQYEQVKEEQGGLEAEEGGLENKEREQVSPSSVPTPAPAIKLVGLRVVGEIQNIGQKRVEAISAVVRFGDENNNFVANKLAVLTEPYEFLGLEPGETGFYDVSVPNPPESARIEIGINPIAGQSLKEDFTGLKISQKKLEEKITSLPAQAGNQGQEMTYFEASGEIWNTEEDKNLMVQAPTVRFWLKDENGQVFGWGQKKFEADLLSSGQKLEFKFFIIPVKAAKLAGFEVEAFGKKYSP